MGKHALLHVSRLELNTAATLPLVRSCLNLRSDQLWLDDLASGNLHLVCECGRDRSWSLVRYHLAVLPIHRVRLSLRTLHYTWVSALFNHSLNACLRVNTCCYSTLFDILSHDIIDLLGLAFHLGLLAVVDRTSGLLRAQLLLTGVSPIQCSVIAALTSCLSKMTSSNPLPPLPFCWLMMGYWCLSRSLRTTCWQSRCSSGLECRCCSCCFLRSYPETLTLWSSPDAVTTSPCSATEQLLLR